MRKNGWTFVMPQELSLQLGIFFRRGSESGDRNCLYKQYLWNNKTLLSAVLDSCPVRADKIAFLGIGKIIFLHQEVRFHSFYDQSIKVGVGPEITG